MLEPAHDELVGMTSLPAGPDDAMALCAASAHTTAALAAGAFEPEVGSSASVVFLLVMDGDVVGITGATFKLAVPNLAVEVVTSLDGAGLDMRSSSTPWTRTELNSSFLAPRARGAGSGRLLSRGRFMFIHQVSRQIPSTIASHLRGRFSSDGTAPFWYRFGDHVTSDWDDSVAAELALAADPSRLADFAGHRRPVTADVLDSLGPVNRASLPAFRLLMREGLRPNGMYDPIDGGPTLVAERDQTMTSKHRWHGRAVVVDEPADPSAALVAVTNVDRFRVTEAAIGLTDDGRIAISRGTASLLDIADDALLTASPLDVS